MAVDAIRADPPHRWASLCVRDQNDEGSRDDMVSSTRSMNRKFVTTAEAAQLAGMTGHALSRRVQAGELTHFIDPSDRRVRLFDVGELERYLQPRPARREEASAA